MAQRPARKTTFTAEEVLARLNLLTSGNESDEEYPCNDDFADFESPDDNCSGPNCYCTRCSNGPSTSTPSTSIGRRASDYLPSTSHYDSDFHPSTSSDDSADEVREVVRKLTKKNPPKRLQRQKQHAVSWRGRGRGRSKTTTRLAFNNLFQWELYNAMDTYHPTDWLPDFTKRTGVLVDTSQFRPVDYFQLFFPDSLFQLMVDQSNLYGEQLLSNITDASTSSIFHNPSEICILEMKAYVALQIAMGLCCKPELSDYWRTYWLTRVQFGSVMARQRYELISSFLHFNDNSQMKLRGQEGYDALFKVRPMLDIVEPLYMRYYSPEKELAIDESMVKFKGCVFFRQFLPLKPVRFGIKQFCLSESKSGYALKFLVYTGKETFSMLQTDGDFSITEQVVLHLLADASLEGCGYTVYTDSFYTSPNLCRELMGKGIGHCGTVKQGRKNMPPELHSSQAKLRKGDDPIYMKSSDNIVACGWHDTKYVTFISSIHTDNYIERTMKSGKHEGGHRQVVKPLIAEDYNQHMGGVDLTDMMLGTYAYPHKVTKWYHALYHRIREVALTNAYILYMKRAGKAAMPPRVFREHVIDDLLEGYDKPTNSRRPMADSPRPSRLLRDKHFPSKIKDGSKPDCTVCSDRKKPGWKPVQTSIKCEDWRRPLH